ncbi:MAG TPA: helix-turn-helix transcriptional regulator [Gaiellaceae bacterium]|nr:helix-turn-helix transcriptional regulator [Gaiellaceae bacterium]
MLSAGATVPRAGLERHGGYFGRSVPPPERTLRVHAHPRQEEVARLILAGLTNDEVAVRLHISPRTARAHADALEARLGVSRRRHIAAAYIALLGQVQL